MPGHGAKPIFFKIKKIKIGRPEHLLTPILLRPITSRFFFNRSPPPTIWHERVIILLISVFLDCTRSAQVRIIKIKFLYLLLSIFWNIQPTFSQKGKSIAPNTSKYLQEHRRNRYSKTKRFAFRLIIGSNLKFKSSKISYMQF